MTFLPFGFLQVAQVLVGHVLLAPLIHLLGCEPLHAIQYSWRQETQGMLLKQQEYMENKKLWLCCCTKSLSVVIHKQRLHDVHLLSFCFVCITMEIFPTSSVASNFPHKAACLKVICASHVNTGACNFRECMCVDMANSNPHNAEEVTGRFPVRLHRGRHRA